MADVKPVTLKPDIADGIYMKFLRNSHIFCIEQHRRNISTGRRQGECKIKDGGLQPEVDMEVDITYISAFTRDSNKIPKAMPMFSLSKQHDWINLTTAVCQGE